jgi:hypothetical protein
MTRARARFHALFPEPPRAAPMARHITCNRCKNVITGPRTTFWFEAIDTPGRLQNPAVDLCTPCADALARWLAPAPPSTSNPLASSRPSHSDATV